MDRDGARIAQPPGAREQERRMAAEKEQRDVGAPRRVQHQDGKEAEQCREPDRRAPLPGRDPHIVGDQQERHDRKAGRIPDVLVVDAEQEFGADRDHARERVQPGCIGAQQQAERKPGNQWRAQVDAGQAEIARAQRLGRQRTRDRQRAVERPGAEVKPADIEDEQCSQGGDLVMARVRPEIARQPALHANSSRVTTRGKFTTCMMTPRGPTVAGTAATPRQFVYHELWLILDALMTQAR